MAAERAIEQALPPGLLTLEMAGVPVRLDFTELMRRFTGAVMPRPGDKLSRKERAMNVAIKGLAILALESIDDAIRAGKMPGFPRPHCPKGVSIVDYWMQYTASLAAFHYRDAVFPVEYGVTDDGGLVITGIGEPFDARELAGVAAPDALPAPAGASGAGAGGAGSGAPGTVEPAESDDGRAYPGEPERSVVHPGLAGVRQDGVRQAAS